MKELVTINLQSLTYWVPAVCVPGQFFFAEGDMGWFGRVIKGHHLPTALTVQGYFLLDHVAQSLIQPGFEHSQGGMIHNFSVQPIIIVIYFIS